MFNITQLISRTDGKWLSVSVNGLTGSLGHLSQTRKGAKCLGLQLQQLQRLIESK